MTQGNHKKMWTSELIMMCCINFLMTSAVFMLFPYQTDLLLRYGCSSLTAVICIFLFFAGMLALGPFNSYMVDAFYRKNICRYSLLFLMVTCTAMEYVPNSYCCMIMRALQGMCFGTFQMALGATVLNDLTLSEHRTASDYYFTWFGLLGLPTGICLSRYLNAINGTHFVYFVIIILLAASFLLLNFLKVPFKAPVQAPLLSLDRFITPKATVVFINLLLVAVVPTMYVNTSSGFVSLLWMSLGALAGFLTHRIFFVDADNRADAVSGFVLIIVAMVMKLKPGDTEDFTMAVFILLGVGISWVISRLLLYFLKTSDHCQRGTLQQTFMLALFLGNCIGFCVGYLINDVSVITLVLSAVSLLFYVCVTHPWFVHHNGREFKYKEV